MTKNQCGLVTTDEYDELRARFTGWLDTVAYRAKLKYLRKQEQELKTISLEDVAEQWMEYQEPGYSSAGVTAQEFVFEEEKLATAFSQLPLMRKEVLRLLFVEELEPLEIATRMNCSVQHVYNQRSLAIKRLRKLLEGGTEG